MAEVGAAAIRRGQLVCSLRRAATDLKGHFTFTENFLAPSGAAESSSFSNTKTGYTVGGGIEVGFWEHWSFKIEYRYVNFGQISANSSNLTTSQGAFPQNVFTHTIDLRANIARVGLNYRF